MTTHDERRERFFAGQAPVWASQYRPGGPMADRIGRFLSALGALVPAGSSLLDFGCGSGDIALAASATGWRVSACDASEAMLAAANNRPGAEAIDWFLAANGRIPGDRLFDAVIASSVLEYVADVAAQMSELARVLKPGGVLLMTVPDMRHPVRRAEEKKRRLAQLTLLTWLLQVTPWGPLYEYLRVSINRWPLDRWIEMAAAAGLGAHSRPAEPSSPLAMLVFRKAPLDSADS
jgi:ubiquinone/menaquinone biosynthesis C-methylase UbiE